MIVLIDYTEINCNENMLLNQAIFIYSALLQICKEIINKKDKKKGRLPCLRFNVELIESGE